ncbi:hypothetical protein HOD38_04925 [archaeon]|jgi:hypothetical protein|nr:hypothetical protein [archaeon]MBT4397584.1 hypothetical protein [archaeon]MBT4440839.1 hypothetical protein [archaeon]
MSLETTFLDRIAERQSSFVLFKGQAYAITEDPINGNFLDIMGSRMALVPSMPFRDFERLDEQLYGADVENYCARYVREKIDSELRAEDEVRRETSRINTLKYLMDRLLPHLVAKKYSSDEILLHEVLGTEVDKGPVDLARDEIREKLNHDFGVEDIEVDEDPAERMRANVLAREKGELDRAPLMGEAGEYDSVLQAVIGNQPIYVMDGRLYALESPGDIERGKFTFVMGGRAYTPSETRLPSLREVSQEILERRKMVWRIAALERSQDTFAGIRDQIHTAEVTERQMHELAKLEEFDLGSCGFVLKDGSYYVYSRVPKFATQDGRDKDVFWPYDATRVAIKIGWSGGQAHSSGDGVVIEKREFHPCLRNRSSGGWKGICNLTRGASDYGKTPAEMVRKLSDAVTVITEPLSEISLKRHGSPGSYSYFGDSVESILGQGSLTREEAEEQGYGIVEVIAKTLELEDLPEIEEVEDEGEDGKVEE